MPSRIPAERVASYQAEQAERTLINVRMYCLVCFAINLVFKAVDYFLYPDRFVWFLAVRLALDAVLVASYFGVTLRNSQRMKRVCLIATGLMLSYVVNATGTYHSDYYVGFLLLMFGMNILFPVTRGEAFILSGLLYLTYLVPALFGRQIEEPIPFLTRNAFLLSGAIISTVSGALGERIRIREFMGRQELMEAYDKLKDLDEAKSQFFSNVSHELRTPLTLLLAPLESMLNGELGVLSEAQRQYLTTMYENGLRLLRQINHLLDVVKIDAKRATLQRENTDLGLFLENLMRATQPLALRKRLSLVWLIDPDLPVTAVDPEKLEKIVLNLLSNAIKFTPSAGSVLLTARRVDETVQLRVSDNGIGIAPEFVPRLFERFAQADGSSRRRYGGTGLGLTLVKEFTEMHGGWVEVESRPGGGATFVVTLPILKVDGAAPTRRGGKDEADPGFAGLEMSDATAPEPREPIQPLPAAGRTAPTLLIVDDNPDMLRFMADALGGAYHVVTAPDGIQALGYASELRPDLIVSDVMMPGMNGIDFCRRLRETAATARIPVILVTARVGLDEKIEGMQQGADEYLYKPFSVAEFRARVEGLLRQRRMERELAVRNEELASKSLRLEELLIHQEKLATLGELLAGTAHELATPITYIASNARALERYVRELEEFVNVARSHGQDTVALDEFVQKLELEHVFEELDDLVQGFLEGGKRATEILSNLRTYSRRDDRAVRETNLVECVKSSLVLLSGHTKGRIRVHREEDPDLPAIRCIEGQVKQVIVNLVSNAIHAIEQEGDIWVEIRLRPEGAEGVRGPCLMLSVRDSGRGIPAGMQEEIFRPFVTTKGEERGTGLGLPICREIVARHGGKIFVASAPGEGSTFTVILPVVPAFETEPEDV
jgi:signal transduction histidine kinase